jgi:uncharacterized protein YmfQ (DUF2313 family)
MSRWHALEGTVFAEDNAGVAIEYWPRRSFEASSRQIADALSDPESIDLAAGAWALLPKGAAWGTPDGIALDPKSVLARAWLARTDAFAALYRDAWRTTMDSSSASLVASLADWEDEFGLPEACVDVYQADDARYRWLRQKVASTGTIKPGDFLRLADVLGYSVVIEEPVISEAGAFECGGPDETGGPAEEWSVVFWVLGAAEYGFEVGVAEAGFTPLYDFDQAEVIECLFDRLLPAPYVPIFDYSALITFSGWPSMWLSVWE